MALQLVYTSAPRLLQAGRTGFGTVAMHSGIPSWLQSEIEGFSQFSRLPGLDTSRVILCHTILGQGDRKHHVFSRIQDCGADYTGRTNHIAHHFIFTASEIIQATKLGLTPVDVLAHLNNGLWKTTWSGDASILDSEDELAIISIPKNTLTLPALAYWGHLCPNHPEYAAILAPSKLSEACWLVYPIGWSEPIIYALGESLLLHTNPWAVTFTNNLQPTDNEQLFAWRCIPSDSPLLEKATSSVRPCIDLSDPSPFLTGIPHDLLEQARTGKKPLPKPRTIEKAVPPPSHFSANQSSEQEAPIPTPSLKRASVPITQIKRPNVGLSSLKRKSPKQKKPSFLIAAISIVFVLILGGAFIGYNKNEDKKNEDEKNKSVQDTHAKWTTFSKIELEKGNLTKSDCEELNKFMNYFDAKKLSEVSWPEVDKFKNDLKLLGKDRDYIKSTVQNAYNEKTKQQKVEEENKKNESLRVATCAALNSKVPNIELDKDKLTESDCNDLNQFITYLDEKKWTEAEKSIAKLGQSGGDREYIKKPMQNAYDEKTKEVVNEYSNLCDSKDFSKIDVNKLKDLVLKFQSPENAAKWTKAIALLSELKESTKTPDSSVTKDAPDSSVTKDALPSETNKIEEASKILLAKYKEATPTPPLPTAPVNPPIYVFLKKPVDYIGQNKEGLIKKDSRDYKKLIIENIFPLNIKDEIMNVTERSFDYFEAASPDCFAVLEKNNGVKHMVLTSNKTLSEILKDSKKPLYYIEDKAPGGHSQVFKFDELFLKRLKNGEKYLKNEKNLDFTFKWELEVIVPIDLKKIDPKKIDPKKIDRDLLDFLNTLNSNGTIFQDIPTIKRDIIDTKKASYKDDAKTAIEKKAKSFNPNYTHDQNTDLKSFTAKLIDDENQKIIVTFGSKNGTIENYSKSTNPDEKLLGETFKEWLKSHTGLIDFDSLKIFKNYIGSQKENIALNSQFKKLLVGARIRDVEESSKKLTEAELNTDFKLLFDDYDKNKKNYDALIKLIPNDSIKVTLKISIDDKPPNQTPTPIIITIDNFPITGVKP